LRPDGPKKGVFQLGRIAQVFGNVLGELEEKYKDFTEKPGRIGGAPSGSSRPTGFSSCRHGRQSAQCGRERHADRRRVIAIGRQAIHTPSASGYLYGFANDAWKFYGNNRGKVSLTIKRVK
jgi:hypothetical protein